MTAMASGASDFSVGGDADAKSRANAFGTAPPTRYEDLTPGLLLFFSRPSLLQSWAERWGQQWRHVGVTVQTPDGLRVASYSVKKCGRVDDLEELMPNYDRIGVASLGVTDTEAEALGEWLCSFENLDRQEAPYTKVGIFFGPLMEIARRRTGLLKAVLLAMVLAYCWFQRALGKRRPAFGCSTFARQALVECTSLNLRTPMMAHPDDEAAYATPTTDRDELLARWLCGPGHLWDAVSASHRSELELDHLVEETTHQVEISRLAPADSDGQIIDLREVESVESRRGMRTVATMARAAFVGLATVLPNG